MTFPLDYAWNVNVVLQGFQNCCFLQYVQTTPYRTHTRALFLPAHARTPGVITRLAQGLDDLLVCRKSHLIIGHVIVECSFDPVSSYFLISCCLTDATYCLTDATDWNQIKPLCNSALGWTVWPSGRFDPKHKSSAQVLHRCQQRAHADQPSEQKHEFPARLRRDDHRSRGPQFTSTFRSIKQQPAHGSRHSSHRVDTRFIRDKPHESVSGL